MSGLILEAEALIAARELAGARALVDAVEAAGEVPDRCDADRWTIHMLRGEFEQAWQASDAIRQRGAADPDRLWQGEDLTGERVMLRCLHGFGDAVQFLRYAPRLRALAAELIVEVNPRFVELARYFEGVGQVITWGEGAPAEPPAWNVQVEVMELPHLFRTRCEELPLRDRYLRLPEVAAPPTGGLLQVGVVWTSGEWNAARSVPFAGLSTLFDEAGCRFWSLERASVGDGRLSQDRAASDSLVGLAMQIAGLHLVITVDTLAAHLAGALGVPCWLMLQHAADWRWMDRRKDSPWYPSLRLFRQPAPGDWGAVVAAVAVALRERVDVHPSQI